MALEGVFGRLFMFPLLDVAGDGTGGGSGDGTGDGTGGTGTGEKTGAGDGTGGQAGGDGKKPAGPAPDANAAEWEKRISGLTADLKKERKARQENERRVAKYESDLAAERKRVQALAGVIPQEPAQVEEEQIRNRFKQLFPELADLTKEDIQAIREMKTRAGEIDETNRHHWSNHARTMVTGVHSAIEKELGGKLTDRQRTQVERLYAMQAEQDQEFLERHTNGDKTLIEEFAKQVIEDWFEPARRRVTQQESQRFRAVPSGKDRGIVTHGEKKIDVNDPKAVEDVLVRGFRERNGEFGRR
jgi:hypothetical protein